MCNCEYITTVLLWWRSAGMVQLYIAGWCFNMDFS